MQHNRKQQYAEPGLLRVKTTKASHLANCDKYDPLWWQQRGLSFVYALLWQSHTGAQVQGLSPMHCYSHRGQQYLHLTAQRRWRIDTAAVMNNRRRRADVAVRDRLTVSCLANITIVSRRAKISLSAPNQCTVTHNAELAGNCPAHYSPPTFPLCPARPRDISEKFKIN